LVVPVGDNQKLLEALLYIMDNYNTYNKNEIADEAKNSFSYPVIGQKFSDLYEEVLEGRI